MNVAPLVIAKQKKVVRRFVEGGATDPSMARVPDDVGVRRSLVFEGLVRRGVLIDDGDGRYHVDVAAAERFHGRRRNVMLTLLAVVAAVACYFLLFKG